MVESCQLAKCDWTNITKCLIRLMPVRIQVTYCLKSNYDWFGRENLSRLSPTYVNCSHFDPLLFFSTILNTVHALECQLVSTSTFIAIGGDDKLLMLCVLSPTFRIKNSIPLSWLARLWMKVLFYYTMMTLFKFVYSHLKVAVHPIQTLRNNHNLYCWLLQLLITFNIIYCIDNNVQSRKLTKIIKITYFPFIIVTYS